MTVLIKSRYHVEHSQPSFESKHNNSEYSCIYFFIFYLSVYLGGLKIKPNLLVAKMTSYSLTIKSTFCCGTCTHFCRDTTLCTPNSWQNSFSWVLSKMVQITLLNSQFSNLNCDKKYNPLSSVLHVNLCLILPLYYNFRTFRTHIQTLISTKELKLKREFQTLEFLCVFRA